MFDTLWDLRDLSKLRSNSLVDVILKVKKLLYVGQSLSNLQATRCIPLRVQEMRLHVPHCLHDSGTLGR